VGSSWEPAGQFGVDPPIGTGAVLINTTRQKPASNTSNTSKTPSDTRTQTVAKPGGSGTQEVLLVLLALLAKKQGVLLGKDRLILSFPALTYSCDTLPRREGQLDGRRVQDDRNGVAGRLGKTCGSGAARPRLGVLARTCLRRSS
jgi:hypothetical protein